MKLLKFLLPLALFLGLWSACKDAESPDLGKTAEVTFVGQVIDENNQPLSGAVVQAGDKSAITDLNGVFRLPATRLAADDARLSVRKSGYFEFSRAYIVKNRAMQTVTIQLLEKSQVGTISAVQGGVVQVPGGPTLNFPANSVMTASGGTYSGTVLVYAKFIDPSTPDLGLRMPGDLRGISAGGEEQVLATFGMIAVEITGTNGEKLQVATGSEVEITMPIASAQSASAPSSIPLWYFDLEKSRWMEEGSAQKVGNQYVGKVKHFSFWNYDASYPSILLHGKVFLGDAQHPLNNVEVWVGPADATLGWGCGHGSTDADGSFGGAVPQGILLKIQVFISNGSVCDHQPLYSQTIGPFDNDATLPDIIISTSQVETTTIEGRLVDCNQQPIVNGYVKIELDHGLTYAAFTTTNGDYQLDLNYCIGLNPTGKVIGYDLDNLRESTPQPFNVSPGNIDLGNLSVCNNLIRFIQYTLDGQQFTLIYPYSYSYNNGTDSRTIISTSDSSFTNSNISMYFYNNQQPGTFAVTNLYVNQLQADSLTMLVNTTISVFESVDAPVSLVGIFGGTFKTSNGADHSINGSYRLARE